MGLKRSTIQTIMAAHKKRWSTKKLFCYRCCSVESLCFGIAENAIVTTLAGRIASSTFKMREVQKGFGASCSLKLSATTEKGKAAAKKTAVKRLARSTVRPASTVGSCCSPSVRNDGVQP